MKFLFLVPSIVCLLVNVNAQKIMVFENAPFIATGEIQQMKNLAEFGESYFYTSTSFKTNSLGDNVLVRVNKNTGKVESNDQVRLGIVASWLTPTEKYIYYPYFESKNASNFYTLKRYDPATGVHETIRSEDRQEIFFTSSFIRLAALYPFKDSVVTIGTTDGLKIPYAKYSSGIFPDTAAFMNNVSVGYVQGPDHVFYTAQVPTENTLTVNNDGMYYFVHSARLRVFNLRLHRRGGAQGRNYESGGNDFFLPFVAANDERAFTLSYDKNDAGGDLVKVNLIEFTNAVGKPVAALAIDRTCLTENTQLTVVGDSVYVSDRWSLYEYNFRSKTVKEHLRLKPNERFYNVQNGKRFHVSPDGTIFYKKMVYADKNETFGTAHVFSFDKATTISKPLFETSPSRNGDDLLKMHDARNNTYFIGNKAVNFKLNTQADKLDILIYDKNANVTNAAVPPVKKFKPSAGFYQELFTAIQTRDAVVFNYGYQRDKKEEKVVVMKLSD